MRTCLAAVVFLSICPTLHAQLQRPLTLAGPAVGAFERIEPAGQIIPKDALFTMYRAGLGERGTGVDLEKLHAAHVLIEAFFDATAKDARQQIVRQISAARIDPNLLGQIAGIRMNWAALAGGVYYINETVGPHEVHYFLGVPAQYDRTKPHPLVIKLTTGSVLLRFTSRTR